MSNTGVNKQILNEWIEANNPGGLKKLAKNSDVSTRTIASVRLGVVPKSLLIRSALAKAVGSSIETLFGAMAVADKDKAS
ncbi:hypothetical protein ACNQKQ_12990 [Bdellovibrio bacteriovorus]